AARGSFAEIIETIAQRDPIRHHARAFSAQVDAALVDGRALLLVDGLDEISSPGDRAAFVSTIRATLLAYPSTAIIVTSRESGFRHIASHLASVCTRATLVPLDADDIRRLSISWHCETIADTAKVREDAALLAQ